MSETITCTDCGNEHRVVNSTDDWRKSAYLDKDNWPCCIPEMGPKRDHGCQAWREPDHDPHDLDKYNWSHPAASSVGINYMGDVCPYCGVPIKMHENVITENNDRGKLVEVSPSENPVPCYHPKCYYERKAKLNGTLGDYE